MTNDAQIIKKLMFTLLPTQVLLAFVYQINNFISSYFASNYLGIEAMGAIGLASPISMFIAAIVTILSGGCAIVCGKYLGQNNNKSLQEVFTLDMVLAIFVGSLFVIVFGGMALFNLTGFFTNDQSIRILLNNYLLGQAIGFIPLVATGQLSVFLLLENQNRLSFIGVIVNIISGFILDYLFIKVLNLGVFGLSLASSISSWILVFIQMSYFFTKKSLLKFTFKKIVFKHSKDIMQIGLPGAISYIFQTFRGLIVNKLLENNIGSVAVSAFAGANNIMNLLWSIPIGMLSVSRLLMSLAVGEEDRTSLLDVMKNMFRRYIPIMLVINVLTILCAGPFTSIYFKPDNQPVFDMTSNGLRILPLCMCFSIIYMHFNCYGQASNKQIYIHTLSFMDGVFSVVLFSMLLIKPLGINGVYIANVLNGVLTTIYIVGYAWFKNKKMPRNIEDLMVIPKDFGVEEKDRIDISVDTIEEAVEIAKQVQSFCKEKGIDERRSYLAGLAMEEMVTNVIEHGFKKDNKKHSIDIRVSYKDDEIIMRIKDNCVPFDPAMRLETIKEKDITKNIGIRLVYKIAKQIDYHNILGLNILTIKI